MFKRKLAVLLTGAIAVTLLAGCSGGKKVTIASKDFTENKILAEMMTQIIENNSDISVERKLNLGGTFVCFEAIKKGQVDIYPEYTGTGLTTQLNLPVENDPEKVYETVKKEFDSQFQITWLLPVGFNNTYALAMPEALAEEKGINSISDLVPHSKDLVFGAEHEFFNREDCYDGLIKVYGLSFKDIAKMNVSLKYQAIGDGKMSVTDAFTTDGQIKELNLRVLEDDKSFFPPYYAAPIIRNETLQKYPQLEELLNKLSGMIDDATMQALNFKADNEKQSIEKVAETFLKEKGLI